MKNSGIMTTREAKNMLGHEITPEMEAQENFDNFVIQGGGSSSLLEEVGVDPIMDPNDKEKANNFVESLEKLKHESK